MRHRYRLRFGLFLPQRVLHGRGLRRHVLHLALVVLYVRGELLGIEQQQQDLLREQGAEQLLLYYGRRLRERLLLLGQH